VQYNELGGIQDSEVLGEWKSSYTGALRVLDGDMPQYIHDNTRMNSPTSSSSSVLASKGADFVSLDPFVLCRAVRRVELSRLDDLPTSCSYRGHQLVDALPQRTKNPDLDPTFQLPQASEFEFWAVSGNSQVGRRFSPKKHIQASPTRRVSTSRSLSKAAPASTHRCSEGNQPEVLASCSASANRDATSNLA